MKYLNKILVIALVLTSTSIVPANAGEDQATYAVVDANGVVTNTIVCGPAVCGPSGSWGGIMPSGTPWAGQKLVLQVPVHSVTGQSLGGYLGTPENPVKYDSQSQTFTRGSAEVPASITNSETVDNTVLYATINSEIITFGPDTVIDNQMQFTPIITPTTGATISAVQSTGETRTVTSASGVAKTESIVLKEMAMFETPKTKAQLQAAIANKLLVIQKYLHRYYILLGGWMVD